MLMQGTHEPSNTMLTHTGMMSHSETNALCLPATRWYKYNNAGPKDDIFQGCLHLFNSSLNLWFPSGTKSISTIKSTWTDHELVRLAPIFFWGTGEQIPDRFRCLILANRHAPLFCSLWVTAPKLTISLPSQSQISRVLSKGFQPVQLSAYAIKRWLINGTWYDTDALQRG